MYEYIAKPIELITSNTIKCIIDLGFKTSTVSCICIIGLPNYVTDSAEERERFVLVQSVIMDYPLKIRVHKEGSYYYAQARIIDGSHDGIDLVKRLQEAGYGIDIT